MLALHGWQDNAGTWERLIPFLLPDVSVLAIDLPGHGLSSHYPAGQMYYLFWDGVYVVSGILNKVTLLFMIMSNFFSFAYLIEQPIEV